MRIKNNPSLYSRWTVSAVSGTAAIDQRSLQWRSSRAPSPERNAGQLHVRRRGVRVPGTVLPVHAAVVQAGQLGLQLLQLEQQRPTGAGAPGRRRRLHAARDHAHGSRRPRWPSRRCRRRRVPSADARAGSRRPRPPSRRHHRHPTVYRRQRVRPLMVAAAAAAFGRQLFAPRTFRGAKTVLLWQRSCRNPECSGHAGRDCWTTVIRKNRYNNIIFCICTVIIMLICWQKCDWKPREKMVYSNKLEKFCTCTDINCLV